MVMGTYPAAQSGAKILIQWRLLQQIHSKLSNEIMTYLWLAVNVDNQLMKQK